MSVSLKMNSLINRKAQAMLELATFGSLVLFCLALLVHFGLSMNYQQNAQMQAFRKALKLAYYKQGPGSQASIVMVNDKPVVDPRDKWGFGDRVPVGGGATVTWDPNLNAMYTSGGYDEEEPDARDLPRVYIEVDKSMRLDKIDNAVDNLGVSGRNVDPNAIKKGIFTTASFGSASFTAADSKLRIYVADSKNEHGGSYYPIDIYAKDVRVLEDPEDPLQNYALYLGADGLARRLSSVDLAPDDGKIKQVNIIAVRGTLPCNPDTLKCGNLAWIRYIDPEGGDINPEFMDVEPGSLVNGQKPLEKQQGLLLNNIKVSNYGRGTKIITKDQGKGFSTVTQSDSSQTITHQIGYQKAGETERQTMNVEVTHKQPAESYNWGVTHE